MCPCRSPSSSRCPSTERRAVSGPCRPPSCAPDACGRGSKPGRCSCPRPRRSRRVDRRDWARPRRSSAASLRRSSACDAGVASATSKDSVDRPRRPSSHPDRRLPDASHRSRPCRCLQLRSPRCPRNRSRRSSHGHHGGDGVAARWTRSRSPTCLPSSRRTSDRRMPARRWQGLDSIGVDRRYPTMSRRRIRSESAHPVVSGSGCGRPRHARRSARETTVRSSIASSWSRIPRKILKARSGRRRTRTSRRRSRRWNSWNGCVLGHLGCRAVAWPRIGFRTRTCRRRHPAPWWWNRRRRPSPASRSSRRIPRRPGCHRSSTGLPSQRRRRGRMRAIHLRGSRRLGVAASKRSGTVPARQPGRGSEPFDLVAARVITHDLRLSPAPDPSCARAEPAVGDLPGLWRARSGGASMFLTASTDARSGVPEAMSTPECRIATQSPTSGKHLGSAAGIGA